MFDNRSTLKQCDVAALIFFLSLTRSNVWSVDAPFQLDSGNPPPSLCQQTPVQIRSGISSQITTRTAKERRSPAVKLSLSLLTLIKALWRRGMQLAGYFCPTTEEVAGESQDPAPPKKAFLPPSFLRLQTKAERSSGMRVDSYRVLLSLVQFIWAQL